MGRSRSRSQQRSGNKRSPSSGNGNTTRKTTKKPGYTPETPDVRVENYSVIVNANTAEQAAAVRGAADHAQELQPLVHTCQPGLPALPTSQAATPNTLARRLLDRVAVSLSLDTLSERWISYTAGLIATVVLASIGIMFRVSDVVISPDQFVLLAKEAEETTPVASGLVSYTFTPQGGREPVQVLQQFGATTRGSDGSGRGTSTAPPGAPPAFRGSLQAMHLDARKPLSIEPAVQFRTAYRLDLIERVTRIPRKNLLMLTSIVRQPRACDVCEVQVTVDAETFHTVRVVLIVRNIGSVTIEELTRTAAAYLPPHRPASAPVRLTPDELDRVELSVRLLLAQTSADLRGHIRISQLSDGVRVQGKFSDAPANTEIGSQLRALEHVRVDGLDASKAKAEEDASAAHARALLSAARVGLQQWRERRFGDAAVRASFLPNLVESLLTVQQRLAVLAELARRYPDPRHDLSDEARATLRQIVEHHYRHLRAELNDARTRVFVLSGSMTLVPDPAHPPAHLLSRAAGALSSARALEHVVGTAMAEEDLGEDAPPRINEAFRALWQAVYGQTPLRE